MSRLRYNGLRATLGGSGLTASATAIAFDAALTSAAGAVPTLAVGDYIPFSVYDGAGKVVEVLHLTAYTTGATTGTIGRAKEGTTAVVHPAGRRLDHGPTKADFAAAEITYAGSTNVAATNVEAALDELDAEKAAVGKTINAQTGTAYTLALTDAGLDKFVTMTNAAASTLTVPPNSSVAFPVGAVVEGAQLGAGQVTLTPGVGVTINGTPGLKVSAQYGGFRLLKTATDTWLATGNLAL